MVYDAVVSEHEPCVPADGDGRVAAGIFYTGGTTGVPKGVVLSHENLLAPGTSCPPSAGSTAPRPGSQLDAAEVMAFCRERIAGYKCPRSGEIRDVLPMTGAGKIDKKSLASATSRTRWRPDWAG